MRPLTDGSTLARHSRTSDLVAVGITVAIGMTRHGEGALPTFVVLLAIFEGAWLLVSWIVGTYRPVTNLGVVLTLLFAVPLGVLIRSLFRDWDVGTVLTVMGVLLLFCTMFVGAGRLIVAFVTRRGVEG